MKSGYHHITVLDRKAAVRAHCGFEAIEDIATAKTEDIERELECLCTAMEEGELGMFMEDLNFMDACADELVNRKKNENKPDSEKPESHA